jgi:hypothetical protein
MPTVSMTNSMTNACWPQPSTACGCRSVHMAHIVACKHCHRCCPAC